MSGSNVPVLGLGQDGLLLDTESIYTHAANEFLSVHKPGATFGWELKSKLMGMTGQDSNRLFLKTYDIDMSVEECTKQLFEIQNKLWPTCAVLPGVERLLKHLKSSGIPIAVATSSTREKMQLKSSNHQHIFSLFGSHITCGDDPEIKAGKPAPDLFLAARGKFGRDGEIPDVERCLVFEDALSGIEAGRRAGMATVWVPDAHLRALERPEGFVEPTETLDSLANFDPVRFGLPAWTQ